jgi:hypothetical protein
VAAAGALDEHPAEQLGEASGETLVDHEDVRRVRSGVDRTDAHQGLVAVDRREGAQDVPPGRVEGEQAPDFEVAGRHAAPLSSSVTWRRSDGPAMRSRTGGPPGTGNVRRSGEKSELSIASNMTRRPDEAAINP